MVREWGKHEVSDWHLGRPVWLCAGEVRKGDVVNRSHGQDGAPQGQGVGRCGAVTVAVDVRGFVPYPDYRLLLDIKWELVQYYTEKVKELRV